MARDNFRVNFLEKISVSGVESGESLSAEAARRLLKSQILDDSSDVDVGKLAQFVAKHPVPQCYRVGVWKLLLGITASLAEGRPIVEQHRMEEAQLLLRSLRVMRKTTASTSCDSPLPSQSDITAMIKLADPSASISALSRNTPTSIPEKALDYIAKGVMPLCSTSEAGWIDAYWLARSIFELLTDTFEEDHRVMQILIDEIKSHGDIAKVSSDAQLLEDNEIELWFYSGGASMLCPDALHRLWDPLCAGGSVDMLLRFALTELIKLSLNISNSQYDVFKKTLQLRDLQIRAVASAIEHCLKLGMLNSKKM